MGKLQQGVNDLYTWCLNNGAFGQKLLSEWVQCLLWKWEKSKVEVF